MQFYLESILISGMFFVAWRLWKMWVPQSEDNPDTNPGKEKHQETPVAQNLFDAVFRMWGLSPEDEEDQKEEEDELDTGEIDDE